MFANSAKRVAAKQAQLTYTNMRMFGVLDKLPKMELTMRTPYNTFFSNYANFTRIYVGTSKG